jgi:hypothetical protein
VRLATDRRPDTDVKLVLAVREADARVIQEGLAGSNQIQTLKLPELDLDSRVEIVQADLPKISVEDAKRLAARLGSNLFLVRAALQAIKDGGSPNDVVDVEHVRDLVAERFLREAEAVFAGTQMRAAREVLLEVCMDVPLPLAKESESLEIATLREAKILRRVGNTLRIRADVEGDVVLGYLSREPALRAQIQRLLRADLQRIPSRIRNLAAAGSKEPAEILRQLCGEWSSRFGSMGGLERAQVVDALPYFVDGAPSEVEEICRQLTAMPGSTTDTIGPVLLAFARRVGVAPCLSLARRISYAGLKEGTFSNYKLAEAGDEIVDLRRVGVSDVRGACDLMEGWIRETASDQDAESIAPLIECATHPMLSHVVRIKETEPGGLRIGEQALAPSAQVIEMRNRALGIAELLLRHPIRRMRVAGAKLLEHHGRGEGGMVSTEGILALTGGEFRRLVPLLTEVLATETDFTILHAVKEEIFSRWATGRPSHREAGDLLRGASFPLALLAFEFVLAPWDWTYDLGQVLKDAPEKERWSWWVDRKMKPNSAEIGRLVDDLVATYKTSDGLVDLLATLPDNDRILALLDPWCAKAPDLFEAALNMATDGRVREAIRRTLSRRSRRTNPSAVVDEVRQALAGGAADRVQEILQEVGAFPAATVMAVSEILVQQPDVPHRVDGIRLIHFRSDIDPATVDRIIRSALRDGDWSGRFDVVWLSLRRDGAVPSGQGATPIGDDLASLLKARLSDAARATTYWVGRDEWHIERLLTELFGSDQDARLAFVADLLPLDNRGLNQICRWSLEPLLQDPAAFQRVAQLGCEWVRAGKLRSVSQLESILDDPIGRRPLPASSKELALKLLDMPGAEEKELGLRFLSNIQTDAEGCRRIADLAAADGPLSEVCQRLLWSYATARGGSMRNFGQQSAKITALKNTLEKARTSVTVPGADALIAAVLENVERQLAKERSDDEEEMDPR